ncbi:hypothetical protein [Sorangium sp. So ce341]|uniref:hypothetical protein n=1 Tax=Sorangium sp. So ce341 TaxID=3133302 RepID=UPI003F627D79
MANNLFALLPVSVASKIRAQIREACMHAPTRYRQNRAKEDAVTGAFGQILSDKVNGTFLDDGTAYRWETTQTQLRAQGPGAPEKRIGADAMIEVAVYDAHEDLILLKCLPMQAKNEWDGKDVLLSREASRLSKLPGDGIVVDYRETGYAAVRASVAARAKGDRRLVPAAAVRPLDEFIADDFFDCLVGSHEYYYDDDAEALVPWNPATLTNLPKMAVRRRIRTKVASARWSVGPKFGSFPSRSGGHGSGPAPTPSFYT